MDIDAYTEVIEPGTPINRDEVGYPQRIWFNAPNHMAKWLRAFKGKFGLSWSQAVREVLRREMERTPIEELMK